MKTHILNYYLKGNLRKLGGVKAAKKKVSEMSSGASGFYITEDHVKSLLARKKLESFHLFKPFAIWSLIVFTMVFLQLTIFVYDNSHGLSILR